MMDWSRLHTELVWAYEGPPTRQQSSRQEYDMLMCWLLLKGSVEAQSISSGTIRAHAGQWVFMPSDKIAHRFSNDARIISLRMIVRWPDDKHLYPYDQWVILQSDDFPRLQRQTHVLINKTEKITQPTKRTKIEITKLAVLPCTLAQYMDVKQATQRWVTLYDHAMQQSGIRRTPLEQVDPRVTEAIQLINNLPAERKFDEAQLAQNVGLSVGQLNRLFNQAINQTPKAYAEKLRLDDTLKLLVSSTMPLKELAYTMGFKQQSHFSNWFHKKTGKFPRQFRKEYQNPGQDQIFQTLKD
jgi:AraC-like DNA-binding protein